MAFNYRITFMMRNRRHDFSLVVREQVWNKVADLLDSQLRESAFSPVTVIRTVDGKCVALNMLEVQGARHLSDAVAAPCDSTIYDGPILIQLRGRHSPLEEQAGSDESIADLIAALEHGPDIVPYVKLLDENGEFLRLSATEIVYVIAPAHQIDAGYEAWERDDEAPPDA